MVAKIDKNESVFVEQTTNRFTADGFVTLNRRITYPSYKSFDDFLDIEKLKALDEFVTRKITEHISTKTEQYFLNAYPLDSISPHQPGAREIWLSTPKFTGESIGDCSLFNELNKPELWQLTPESANFDALMDFVSLLPFKATSRILIIYDDAETSVPAHRDHLSRDLCQEFVWFRTNLKKPFYMLNHQTNEKQYVETYSAWFDTVNQFHGTDPVKGLNFSIRVDGHFTDQFRKQIPFLEENRASAPALWASIGQ
jgi:hypothetical protein